MTVPGSDCGVAFAARRDGPGKRGDRFGQLDGHAAEAEPDGSLADLDLADGHPADRCRPLGVEEHEQAGEAVFRLERLVVQEPAGGVQRSW